MPLISSWTERQIAAGILSPGARGMTPAAAAAQYNEVNALEPGDPGYLEAPPPRALSNLIQIVEERTWLHPECLLPLQYDTGWHEQSRRDVPAANRLRITRRERKAGRAPGADGWLSLGITPLDYPDGLKLLSTASLMSPLVAR